MLHQPFEAWIINPAQLSPQERETLHAHLESCPRCRELANGWKGAEGELNQRVMVSPRPGFLQRFQARVAASHARNPITLRKITPVLLVALVVVSIALIVQYFSTHSFVELVNEISRGFIWISGQIQGILRAINDWLSNPLAHIPLALVVFVALVITLVWLTTLWRILRKGEIRNNE